MSESDAGNITGLQADWPALVLASRSQSRARLLRDAGITFTQTPSGLDEQSARAALGGEAGMSTPGDMAELLAIAKGTEVSTANPEALVIGADQILVADGQIFEKPEDLEAARKQLLQLRGKTHALHCGVCICQAGTYLWSHVDTVTLKMRDFSPAFAGRYVSAAGPTVLGCVGAYQLEGVGAQLFEAVDGDYFSVLGLPLLPLLGKLRKMGVLLV